MAWETVIGLEVHAQLATGAEAAERDAVLVRDVAVVDVRRGDEAFRHSDAVNLWA